MENNTQADNMFSGYSLFNDIENFELRARNRGIIMSNILEDNLIKELVSRRGISIVKKYLEKIPLLERKAAVDALYTSLLERGFDLEGVHE